MTRTSVGWGARRRESRAGTDIRSRDRRRRPSVARGRRPRRGHDAGGRRASRRQGPVALQAVPEPRRPDRRDRRGGPPRAATTDGAGRRHDRPRGRHPRGRRRLSSLRPRVAANVRAPLHEPAPGFAASPEQNALAVAPLLALTERLVGPEQALEAARLVTAFAHGFISMELSGAFRLGGDLDEAYRYGVDVLIGALAARRASSTGCDRRSGG